MGVKARAIYAYLNEAKRLYNVMYFRNETSPISLLNYHFQYLHDYLAEIGYVQLYDATTNLSKISSIIDSFGISVSETAYKTSEKPKRQHLKVKHKDEEPEGKEFSRAAVEAYAIATNNPISEGEEILLRTLDLLFAMGQRANEVTHIPLDCWVERVEKDAHGRIIRNPKSGEAINTYGVRYYAEKKAQDRVHWFADQDVSFARRAVERLKILTEKARVVAKFQRINPERMWNLDPNQEMYYPEIMEYLSFASQDGLQKFLKKLRVTPLSPGKYRAGDIEHAMLKNKNFGTNIASTVALADDSGKPVLYKEQLLGLAFDGDFRMKRKDNLLRVVVAKLTVVDLNCVLGAVHGYESIFDRRGLTEADGSRIVMTTHMPRHWRNTLYEIAGMSEAQQALALGRADISQNPHYQHATIEEKNASLHEFINTRNPQKRLELFKEGIRDGTIQGSVPNTYNKLRARSPVEAEEFLETHVMAAHVTPYGACSHDFSKAPCPKHLQCFDSCSHLHRTENPNEAMQLDELIAMQGKNIDRMKQCGCGDAGADTWIEIEERKLKGMEAAREIYAPGTSIQIFPEGKVVNGKRRRSAVRED
ncbi:MAG: hypothetical protein PHD04_02915 [Candidatus Pacebacteria bacterium]|nr:hypothetical protein [Candidatus Paceibacterota bacterium]